MIADQVPLQFLLPCTPSTCQVKIEDISEKELDWQYLHFVSTLLCTQSASTNSCDDVCGVVGVGVGAKSLLILILNYKSRTVQRCRYLLEHFFNLSPLCYSAYVVGRLLHYLSVSTRCLRWKGQTEYWLE